MAATDYEQLAQWEQWIETSDYELEVGVVPAIGAVRKPTGWIQKTMDKLCDAFTPTLDWPEISQGSQIRHHHAEKQWDMPGDKIRTLVETYFRSPQQQHRVLAVVIVCRKSCLSNLRPLYVKIASVEKPPKGPLPNGTGLGMSGHAAMHLPAKFEPRYDCPQSSKMLDALMVAAKHTNHTVSHFVDVLVDLVDGKAALKDNGDVFYPEKPRRCSDLSVDAIHFYHSVEMV